MCLTDFSFVCHLVKPSMLKSFSFTDVVIDRNNGYRLSRPVSLKCPVTNHIDRPAIACCVAKLATPALVTQQIGPDLG